MPKRLALIAAILVLAPLSTHALERAGTEFKIFQFPRTMIPTIDGATADWDIVPASYVIGADQLRDTVGSEPPAAPDPADYSCTVKVGWVKGMNRLYFLYEAFDDYWDFERLSLQNDIFELVVDGDLSGGPLIRQMNPNRDIVKDIDLHFTFHGVHAQNYHIFTPPGDKDWCMMWGCPQWTKDLPYANYAYDYNFRHGESGRLVLEFWITPFDYAAYEGPGRSVESTLTENALIGMSWSVLEYDDNPRYKSFLNLSHKTTMYGDASDLCAFRLMPLEPAYVPALKADFTFTIIDLERRVVAFEDRSIGKVTGWSWEFGEETSERVPAKVTTSTEQHPVHTFATPGEKTVTLTVTGPDGSSRFCRVWDVVVK